MQSRFYLLSGFIAFIFSACHSSDNKTEKVKVKNDHKAVAVQVNSTNNYGKVLALNKSLIDRQAADTSKLMVLVKVPGRKKLIQVIDDKYPDEIETTYNLLKDKEGHIVYAVEIPESESGDWFISYKSYFKADGKLFAFERQAGIFNGECTKEEDEPLNERLIRYYDSHFNVVDSVYGLKDSKGKILSKSACVLNYDYPYQVAKSINAYKKLNQIP
jgi:hypothetical protein